jgi:PKD repeat protein
MLLSRVVSFLKRKLKKEKMKYIKISMLFLVLTFVACEPTLEDKIELGTPPQASFSHVFVDGNNVTFTNTTTDEHFLVHWDIEGNGVFEDNEVEINFFNAGDYEVKFSVFGEGGSTTVTEIITIVQDDPGNCEPILDFITGCGEKTWSLFNGEGALFVGPGDGSVWWQNTAADATTRSCDWNDTYTFKKESSVFDYKANGDFWGEAYTGVSPDGCEDIVNLDPSIAAWGDGVHSFEIILATATTPNQLKVVGTGAFIGLRKAVNGTELAAPITLVNSVTYDILSTTTDTAAGKYLLELQVDSGGVFWKFILESTI